MRVLFVEPSVGAFPCVSLGLASLAGFLGSKGHEVRLLQISERLWPIPSNLEIVEIVAEHRSDLIAFLVREDQVEWSRPVVEALREKYPRIPIGTEAGGFTRLSPAPDPGGGGTDPRDLVDDFVKDLATFRDLVGRARQVLRPALRLDWELYDLERILSARQGCLGMRLTIPGTSRPVEIPLQDVLEEVRRLQLRFPELTSFSLDEPSIALDRVALTQLCRANRRQDLRIPFIVDAHLSTFDEELAHSLKEAGCKLCRFDIERASDRYGHDHLRVPFGCHALERAMHIAHECGLHTSASLRLGLASETRDDDLETLELCARVKPGRVRWIPCAETPDLWQEKVFALAHWWMNALSDWPSAGIYRRLVEEIESLDVDNWRVRQAGLREEDRELSEELIEKGLPHYSIRLNHRIAVSSEVIVPRAGRPENEDAAVRWVATQAH